MNSDPTWFAQQDRVKRQEADAAEAAAPFEWIDLLKLSEQEPQPAEFVVERVLPRGEVTFLNGAAGDGKTLLAMMLMVAIAASLKSVLGMAVSPGPVVFYTCEDSTRELHWRLAAICRRLDVDLAALYGRLFIVNRRGEVENHFGTFEADGTYKPATAFKRLEVMIETVRPALVVVDNLAHVYVGNENDRMQVTQAMSHIVRAADRWECAFALIAHPPKSGDSYSGSTGWMANVRSQMVIEREKDGDPDVRVLSVGKSNYAKTGEVSRFRWLDHSFVCDGELPESISAQLASTSRATSANDAFLACLDQVVEQGRTVSDTGTRNYAPKVFARMKGSKGFSADELAAAMERLLDLGLIKANQPVGQYANRTVKHGLARVDESAQLPAQLPAQSAAQELHNSAQVYPNDCTIAARSSNLYPTDIEDGASGSPSSNPEDRIEAGETYHSDWDGKGLPGD